MKQPTLAEVARRAGVSKATVSAVINNKEVVRESTRQAILAVIDELNYQLPASFRRRLPGAGGLSICYIVKEAHNPYYIEILDGIKAVAREYGCVIFMSSSEGDYNNERAIVEQCTARNIDGLIITPIVTDNSDLSHIFELKRNQTPFVLLERVRGLQANLVDIDNVAASCAAVTYLIRNGHSRIAHFAGPSYSAHSEERLEGVRRAFSETHLVLDRKMIVPTGDSFQHGYEEALRFFREMGDRRPTAVTCYNDLVALGVMKALAELGLRVPRDVSVVGFDDLDMLKYTTVPLTSVHVPKFEMGKRAMEILIEQVRATRELPVQRISLDAELMIHASTCALEPAAGIPVIPSLA